MDWLQESETWLIILMVVVSAALWWWIDRHRARDDEVAASEVAASEAAASEAAAPPARLEPVKPDIALAEPARFAPQEAAETKLAKLAETTSQATSWATEAKSKPAASPIDSSHEVKAVITETARLDRPKIAPPSSLRSDNLLLLKGIGPKLNTHLAAMGVTQFEQIAQWTTDDIAEVERFMGNFVGRIERDHWVEQARYLACGDKAGFEAKYGALGGEL